MINILIHKSYKHIAQPKPYNIKGALVFAMLQTGIILPFETLKHRAQLSRIQSNHASLWRGLGPAALQYSSSPLIKILVYNTVLPWLPNDMNNQWKASITGGCAGGLKTLLLFPIDTIKVETQTSKRKPISIIRHTMNHHGITGFYKGLTPCFARSTANTSIWFGMHTFLEHHLPECYGKAILTGAGAGLASVITTYPLDVIKTQTQTSKQNWRTFIPFNKGTINWKQGFKGIQYGLLQVSLMGAVFSETNRFFETKK